jgi:hypothetical protein
MTYLIGWLLGYFVEWLDGVTGVCLCMSIYVYVHSIYKYMSCNWGCLYRSQNSVLTLCNK